MRAGEDLAAGHVAAAVGVDPGAPLDVQPQVGAGGLDVDLTRRRKPLDHAGLLLAQARPGRDRVGLVEEQRALDEVGVILLGHAGLLRERRRRPDRQRPALPRARLAQRLLSPRPAGDERRVDVGQRVRAGRRHDPHAGVGRLGLGQLDRRDAIEVLVARVPEEVGLEPGRREPQQRPAAALEHRPVQRDRRLLRERRRLDQDLLAGLDLQAPVGDQHGKGVRVDHGASRSGKFSATCSRRLSRTNRRSSAVAIR